jgi:Gas vesicle synthesis protein GvpL/GvpF
VRGAVELSVRAIAAGKRPGGLPAPSVSSGAEYLRLRARAEANHDRAARALHEPLSGLARASLEARPRPPELFRAAYLVEREAIEPFAAEVAQLQEANAGFSILCTGPWPPYSFVER